MNDFPIANQERDKRLRRKMLTTLKLAYAVSPRKGLGGRTLRDQVDGVMPRADRTDGDDHALSLVRDLVGKGYVEERDERTRKRQIFSLDFLFFTITARGIDLWNEAIPVDPLVEDDRLSKD